ncbi:MAG: protein phosphatase 2C domain-containing protein [Leptospiraceae bacterium]|nr:protein phosphatase 2C domain-containing protein [Leptospiraceae bacterium]
MKRLISHQDFHNYYNEIYKKDKPFIIMAIFAGDEEKYIKENSTKIIMFIKDRCIKKLFSSELKSFLIQNNYELEVSIDENGIFDDYKKTREILKFDKEEKEKINEYLDLSKRINPIYYKGKINKSHENTESSFTVKVQQESIQKQDFQINQEHGKKDDLHTNRSKEESVKKIITTTQTNSIPANQAKPPEKKIREYNLPNGMVDSKYEEKIQLPKNITPSKVTPNWDDSFGVTFDKELSKLTGIPTKSGNYFIEFFYGSDSDKYKFTINPDPKKLWKDIPPPDNAPFSTKSEFSESIELKNKKIITASKRGRSHAHEGKFREDNSRIFRVVEEDFIFSVLVVSDGAGSALYSREGSRIVCDKISDYFSSNYAEIKKMNLELNEKETKEIKHFFLKPIREAVDSVRKNIIKTAEEYKYEIKDFAATCLFLLYIQNPKNKSVWLYPFGLEMVLFVSMTKKISKVIRKPDSGQYSGETRFYYLR